LIFFALLVGGTMAALPTSAQANHSLKELLSTGPSGGNAPQDATFEAASQDGSRVFFTTAEALVSADTDAGKDVYERSNGVTTLISVGVQPGPSDVTSVKASPDGSRVFFQTPDQLVTADMDNSDDVYERTGGVTSLFPTDAAANGNSDFEIKGISQDGARVFFESMKQLVGSDTDSGKDVYERSGGTVSLVSPGGNGTGVSLFAGATPDGTRVYLNSNEPLVAGDTDGQTDVYERAAGTTTLISTGPNGGNGPNFAVFRGVTPDGSSVYFVTLESLVISDTDTNQDVYSRSGATTTLVSTGAGGGNGAFTADFAGVSIDGVRIFFITAEQLVGADNDSAVDIYERSGGATTLISTGSNPCSGTCSNATFEGSTTDGSRVWFETGEALDSNDADTRTDVYERSGGSTTLLSTGPGTPCCSDLTFQGASQDGTRVFFGTSNSSFERFGGDTTTLVSNGAFKGSSLDGKRVFVQTNQPLVLGDTDAAQDVYSLSVIPYEVPDAASPINVSLVPVFRQCGTGANPANGEHSAPLSVHSCGTPAATGTAHFGAQGSGSARISALPGDPSTGADESDVSFNINLSDIRGGSPTGADYNPNPSGPDLTLGVRWRLTDNSNGPNSTDAATATDLEFKVPADCIGTSDPTVGSGCGTITSADAVVPGSIQESKGMVIQTFRFRVSDSGPDGVRGNGDDALFAQQGIYVP
jgi:hypothetical protein